MVDDLDTRIGLRLRQIRIRAGLDIETLARRGGIPPATLALYEDGCRRIPVGVLTRLAQVLGAALEDFFA